MTAPFYVILSLSVVATLGACWARRKDTLRRLCLLVASWLLASIVLWQLMVDRHDWAARYFLEVWIAHAFASFCPAALAFRLLRDLKLSERRRLIPRVAVVGIVGLITAVPGATIAACALDTTCYI